MSERNGGIFSRKFAKLTTGSVLALTALIGGIEFLPTALQDKIIVPLVTDGNRNVFYSVDETSKIFDKTTLNYGLESLLDVSPNGKLAFVVVNATNTSPQKQYISYLKTSERKEILNPGVYDIDTANFSPDSTKVVLNENSWMYLYDVETNESKQLPIFNAGFSSWSPDGRSIIYNEESPINTNVIPPAIKILDLSTGESFDLGYNGFGPQYTPDDNISFIGRRTSLDFLELKIITKDGKPIQDFKIFLQSVYIIRWLSKEVVFIEGDNDGPKSPIRIFVDTKTGIIDTKDVSKLTK